ncbi:TrbC family F-type conjugative pilus assembly protein [Salinisphaera sp. P385]|uniref:TrbC family F-type conjugative pilus assembly protein n=1 Tax=Spectribacter acetivorans TaxID=3075603 RepID=A0ABU3B7Z6_9GAMM|nr:TrbC family F-type conjugative pilus assembly protein [Salinisphaera sp. P385]MDT0618581.1 TrbC family F-type conjugative pilus assembly protein [Salinisphaera sp. P385]
MTRFVVCLLAGLSAATALHAQPSGNTDADLKEILERAEQAIRHAKENPPDWLETEPPEEYRDIGAEIAEKARQAQRDAVAAAGEKQGMDMSGLEPDVSGNAGVILAFASTGMPESELRSLLEVAAVNPKVVVLFRGLLPGDANLRESLLRFNAMTDGLDPKPSVQIHPKPFQRYRVTAVPTLVMLSDKPGQPTVRVEGSINLDWLKEQGEKRLSEDADPDLSADLGRVGQVYDIAEQDLLELMKSRVASIDWEQKKRQARERFWTNHPPFIELPLAKADEVRLVDPTVIVKEDVPKPDGSGLLARAGESYNPLDKISFTRRVFIFDATDPRQIEYVIEQSETPLPGKLDVFITTAIDRDKGFDFITEVEDKLGMPIFLLKRDLAIMLRIRAIPSVVTGEGKRLRIQEVGLAL